MDATTPEGRVKVEAALLGKHCQPLREAGNEDGYNVCTARVRAYPDQNPNTWIGTKTYKPDILKW